MDEKLLTAWLYEGSYEQPLAKPMFICEECGDIIYGEDYYYEILGNIICEDCIEDGKKIAYEREQ